MRLKFLSLLIAAIILPMAVSCEEDELLTDDKNSEGSTPVDSIGLVPIDKINNMLADDGYIDMNVAVMCELSGDNFEDNVALGYDLDAFEEMDDEIFAWKDVTLGNTDSPLNIWESCYKAIATANKALACVADYESAGRKSDVSAIKGEALLIRAYHHFVLANMFCGAYRGRELSLAMPGIPYATDTVSAELSLPLDTNRGTLTDTYEKIEKDLTEGLPLIEESRYERPKYRFNRNAANAFAARFYLYKRDYDKVIEYADAALGTSGIPTGFSDIWNINFESPEEIHEYYTGEERQNNFLLIDTYSNYMRRMGLRYTINGDGAKATLLSYGPSWNNFYFHPCYTGKIYINGNQEYGYFFPGIFETFEYTDIDSQIGYPHIIRPEFTLEETVLCRAEAKFYMKDIAGGLADLRAWDEARQNCSDVCGLGVHEQLSELTSDAIINFYEKSDPCHGIVKEFHIDEICPSSIYKVSIDIEPYLQCTLHFRRIQCLGEGQRWMDIKRYGLEIIHKIGQSHIEMLTINDPRCAFQLPADAIMAGVEPNNR